MNWVIGSKHSNLYNVAYVSNVRTTDDVNIIEMQSCDPVIQMLKFQQRAL